MFEPFFVIIKDVIAEVELYDPETNDAVATALWFGKLPAPKIFFVVAPV